MSVGDYRYGALIVKESGKAVACGLCDAPIIVTDDPRFVRKLVLHESSFTGDRFVFTFDDKSVDDDAVETLEKHLRDFHRAELRTDIHP